LYFRGHFFKLATVIEKFIEYVRYEKRYSFHTVKLYTLELRLFEKFVKASFDIGITEAKRGHLKAWLYLLSEKDLKPRSINVKISVLKSFFGFLYRKGLIEVNPSKNFFRFRKERMLPYFVDEDDLSRLLDDLEFPPGYVGARDKLIIEVLYGTGLRVSELASLKDFMFNPYRKQIHVQGKGTKERIVPLYDKLSSEVDKYSKHKIELFPRSEFLFLGDKGLPISTRRIAEIVNKYLSLVTDLEKKSPHVLRHSFATHLVNNGAPTPAIKDLLGHEALATTQVYTHLNMKKLKEDYKKGGF
jgi:integrase/recombinase XerC